jgi:uncharacterized membrane protein YhaH (DUF805 family)
MDWMLLPYRRYFEFSGRSRRREYWMFTLFYVLVLAVIETIFGVPHAMRMGDAFSYGVIANGTGTTIGNLFWLASIIPGFAVSVRRLHDIDRSGWWMLLAFIPFLGWFTLLIFYCLDGTAGSNRFGADPKERGVVDVFR